MRPDLSRAYSGAAAARGTVSLGGPGAVSDAIATPLQTYTTGAVSRAEERPPPR